MFSRVLKQMLCFNTFILGEALPYIDLHSIALRHQNVSGDQIIIDHFFQVIQRNLRVYNIVINRSHSLYTDLTVFYFNTIFVESYEPKKTQNLSGELTIVNQ